MNGTGMRGISRSPLRGFAWVGKAALLCLGLLAMLTLVVVMVVLTAVMLTAAILPAPAVRPKRVRRGQQDSGDASISFSTKKAVTVGQNVTATATGPEGNTSEFSAARKAVGR